MHVHVHVLAPAVLHDLQQQQQEQQGQQGQQQSGMDWEMVKRAGAYKSSERVMWSGVLVAGPQASRHAPNASSAQLVVALYMRRQRTHAFLCPDIQSEVVNELSVKPSAAGREGWADSGSAGQL